MKLSSKLKTVGRGAKGGAKLVGKSAKGGAKLLGKGAKAQAELMGHQVKDKALERRIDRLDEENRELRVENRTLKDEVKTSRADLQKLIDMFERHTAEGGSHKGRWLLFLMAAGGGAYYAWTRMMGGNGSMWSERVSETFSGVRSGAASTA